MDRPMQQAKALLLNMIRLGLERGDEVRIPGLGTFRAEHLPSQVAQRPDGSMEMTPPRREIRFTPDP